MTYHFEMRNGESVQESYRINCEADMEVKFGKEIYSSSGSASFEEVLGALPGLA